MVSYFNSMGGGFILRLKSGWGAQTAFIILLALTLFIPVIFPLTALCLAAPLLWLFVEGHWRKAMVLVTAAMLASLLSNMWLVLWLFFITTLIFSYLLGRGLQKQEVGHYAVNATLTWIVFALLLFVIAKVAGINIITLFTQAMVQGIRSSPLLSSLENLSSSSQGKAAMAQLVQLVLPGSMIILSTMVTLCNLAIVRFVQTLLYPQSSPVMRNFRLPRSVGVAYVVVLVALLTGFGSSSGVVSLFVNTASLVLTFLLSLQASAVLWWIVREKVKAVPLTILAVVAAFFVLLILIVLEEIFVLFGLVDVIFYIRTRLSTSCKSTIFI